MTYSSESSVLYSGQKASPYSSARGAPVLVDQWTWLADAVYIYVRGWLRYTCTRLAAQYMHAVGYAIHVRGSLRLYNDAHFPMYTALDSPTGTSDWTT